MRSRNLLEALISRFRGCAYLRTQRNMKIHGLTGILVMIRCCTQRFPWNLSLCSSGGAGHYSRTV